MNKRPIPVTVLSLVLIATGAMGLLTQHSFQYDAIPVALVRLAAIICGLYMLRAHNWARWLALAWIALHVILSIFNSPLQLAIHILVAAAFGYFLFRPQANDYFRHAAREMRL